jgi:hypothetical protein
MIYIIILVIILIKNIEMSELQENTNKIENMSKNEILKNIEELNIQYKVLLEKEVLLNQEMSELQENADKIKNMSKDEILQKIKELNSQYAELLKNEEILNNLQKIMYFDKSEIKNIENKIKDFKYIRESIRRASQKEMVDAVQKENQMIENQKIILEINEKYDKYKWSLDKHLERNEFSLINNKLLKLMKLRKFYHDTEQKLQEIYEKYENKQKLENIIILYYEILEIK